MTGMGKIASEPRGESVIDDQFEPVSRRPLYQQVRDRITQLIDDGMLKVGDQLPSERALSARLGVSRHSLRQAMSALEAQGLIEIRHGSGAYLVEREPGQVASDIADALIDSTEKLPYVMEARFAIEPFLTGLAADRRTPADLRAIRAALNMMEREIAEGDTGEKGDIAFHAAVLTAAHNPIFVDFMTRLQPDMTRLREEALAQPTTPRLAIEAHHAILAAIEAGDREGAFRAAHQHLVDAAEALLVSELGTPSYAFLAQLLMKATGEPETPDFPEPNTAIRRVTPAALAASLTPQHLGETVEAVREETGLDTIHKLDSTENPYGCSPRASEAVITAATQLSAYPDAEAGELRAVIARMHGVDTDQIVFGSGSDEVLLLTARTFLAAGRSAAACEPTSPQYRTHTLSTGASYVPVALDRGRPDFVGLAAAASTASVLWVCNPNTPTGGYLGAEGLKRLMANVPQNVIVVVDEAYADYATAADFPDSVALIDSYPNLIVTRTFSTIHGLAGLRIGYGIADARVANLLNAVKSPFNTSNLAQSAARASALDEDFIRRSRERNAQERTVIESFCRDRGIDYFPSQANFVLFDAPGGAPSTYEALKERGFLVKPGTHLGVPSKIRLSVGTPDQVSGALAALEDLL